MPQPPATIELVRILIAKPQPWLFPALRCKQKRIPPNRNPWAAIEGFDLADCCGRAWSQIWNGELETDISVLCSSKRRKFVADGVFYAELNEFFQRELAEEGYSGVEVRVTPTVTDIIIRATHTQEVLGEQGRRIRELTSLIQKRFKFPENSVSLYAAKVQNRGLSAVAQCESLRYKLLNGLAVRRACYGVLRFIMESGAKGCEVVVSGKLRAARAKSMKFTDGFMIHSGQPAKDFIDSATRHVLLRQGVLGIKVKIMRGSDPEGKAGPQKSLPDAVTIIEPKEETPVVQPMSQDYGAKAAAAQAAAEAARQEEQAGEEEQAPAEQ